MNLTSKERQQYEQACAEIKKHCKKELIETHWLWRNPKSRARTTASGHVISRPPRRKEVYRVTMNGTINDIENALKVCNANAEQGTNAKWGLRQDLLDAAEDFLAVLYLVKDEADNCRTHNDMQFETAHKKAHRLMITNGFIKEEQK